MDKYLIDCLDALIEMKEEAVTDEEDNGIDREIGILIQRIQSSGMMF